MTTKGLTIHTTFILFIAILFSSNINAQYTGDGGATSNNDIDKWDNQFLVGNKYSWSKGNWRYSGELHFRLKNDVRSLNQYYLEGVATYQPNNNWEIVPDLRATVFPDRVELRPGIGLIYKINWNRKNLNQIVQQTKWQTDIKNTGYVSHAVRYMLFYNYVFDKKWMAHTAGGVLYRFSDSYNGVEFIRALVGATYSFNDYNSLYISYFVGAENRQTHYTFIGGPLIQFIIRFSRDHKYIPAEYMNF